MASREARQGMVAALQILSQLCGLVQLGPLTPAIAGAKTDSGKSRSLTEP